MRVVPRDYAEAVKWFRKAAEQGAPLGQYNLALMYAQGMGVPKNSDEAVKWMMKAAQRSLPQGLKWLRDRGYAAQS